MIPAKTDPLRGELKNTRDYEHLMTIIAGQFTGVGMIPYEVYAKPKPNHTTPSSPITNDLGVKRLAEETRLLQQRVNALESVVRFTDLREKTALAEHLLDLPGLPATICTLGTSLPQ